MPVMRSLPSPIAAMPKRSPWRSASSIRQAASAFAASSRDQPGRAASSCDIDALVSISSHSVERAVALGFAHEEAVRARVELPVDLAQFVAGFVGAVLRELQPGAAAAAAMQAEALHAARPGARSVAGPSAAREPAAG